MGCHALEDRECQDDGVFLIEVTSRGDDASMLRTRAVIIVFLSNTVLEYTHVRNVHTIVHTSQR